jgi:hypothetical protein
MKASSGRTKTITVSEAVHPLLSVTVTVYVVVLTGDAFGLLILALSRETIGCQLKRLALEFALSAASSFS